MCGFAVAVRWDGAESAVRRLIAGMLHRGDVTDPVVTIGDRIAMCTRRLRIVDAAHGTQPQTSFDDRFLVALNGEIYNHADLRHELEALGVPFRTECDTEVIANVLRVWGPLGIRRLRGMFAFVAVDAATGDFLAARDPFGVKPLYLVKSGDGFLFCSEIRQLLRETERGDVLLLPPGQLLTQQFCGRHYSPPPPNRARTTAEELDRIVAEAVRVRIPNDLPVATLFSGGIDSTLVAHYARRIRPEMPGYIAVGSNAAARDLVYAERYTEATGFDLRQVPIEILSARTLPLLATVVSTVEAFEPAVIRPSLYTYLVSERIHRDGYRVALCGEGADELFAGYEPLEYAFTQADSLGRHLQAQCLNMMHRANLQRVDRCSMRFQLEIREPFLDQSVVACTAGLGKADLLARAGDAVVGKAPLRALYNLYPAELPACIRDRQKLPFHEGAGASDENIWLDLFDAAVSDGELHDGQREFADFRIATKEELFFMRALAATMDVRRVPHLRGRLRLDMNARRQPGRPMPMRKLRAPRAEAGASLPSRQQGGWSAA